jgi:hypothetical protein
MFYDDVDAALVRQTFDFLRDVLLMVVDHFIGPKRARLLQFRFGSGSGNHPRALQPRAPGQSGN